MGYLYKEGLIERSSLVKAMTNTTMKRTLMTLTGLTTCLLIGAAQRELQLNDHWSYSKELFYAVYSRAVFPLALNIALLPALLGKGRLLRTLLGNRLMIILGRLSFCTYLVHQVVLSFTATNTKTAIIFDHRLNFLRAIHCWGWSVVWGCVLSMMVEMPGMRLLRMVSGGASQKVKVDTNKPAEVKSELINFDQFERQLTKTFSDKMDK